MIGGIEPARINENITTCSYYLYIFKYRPLQWNGASRRALINALVAEGIPVTSGYDLPLYANPVFLEKRFYPKDCPAGCSLYRRDIDYHDFRKLCPATERACYEEAIWLPQNVLLGSREDIDDVVRAFEKVREIIHKKGD